MSSDAWGHRVLARLRRPRVAVVVLVVGAGVLLLDLAVAWLQDGRPASLAERVVVLLLSVPPMAWYIANRGNLRSEARELELHERQETLLGNISDLIFVVDPDGTVRYQSPSVERTLGYAPGDLIDTRIENLVSAQDGPAVVDLLGGLHPGDRATIECQIRHRDGSLLPVEVAAMDTHADGSPDAPGRGVILTMHDVSRWKALEEQLTQQALHDPLTSLPNRTLYIDRVEHALRRRRRHARHVAVLFLDLDDFKTVNDSLGHAAGDMLIRDVALRLQSSVRPGDTAARLGGDEFALLLEDVDEAQAVLVATRALGELEAPFDLGDRSLMMGASIGIALNSDDLSSAADMLRAADAAMYEAKDAGKGQYRIFEPAMHHASAERLRLGADLRGAVERGEFVVHYQPIVDLPSGAVTAMEALVRWRHPERGLLPPAAFIPLAERSGLIVELGAFVLREACRQSGRWGQERVGRPIGVSVNVSSIQLQEPGFVAAVSLALEESQLAPALLTLEITESVMALDDEAVGRRLRQLKGLGVRLAIDDFGTGFSALSSIARFPVDEVKIDRGFVTAIEQGGQHAALARAIVRLAHSLKLETVAEGVETDEQARRLASTGCDRAQGFLFSKPLEAREASAYLLGHSQIEMWVGYSGQELDVITEVVGDFQARNPRIKVEVVGGVDDERILAALADGTAGHVVSSIESGNVAVFAGAGRLSDLSPYLARDGIEEDTFVQVTASYTASGSRRWALPLLADAYGLYYNRRLLADAGLAGPPRTMSELASYAKRLTKRRSDGSLEVVGFNPLFGFYENAVPPFAHQFGARWLGDRGESTVASDLAWPRMLRWQKALVDWYGYEELLRFGESVGDEFSADNGFETGRLALALDGEWRVAFIAANGARVDFGAAPMPVDDDRPELYGSGFINGSSISIPAAAGAQDEAWELIKYLTTDESAMVKLANGLRNIPSTYAALASPALVRDPNSSVFLEIFAHPRSSTPPMTAAGPSYEDAVAAFALRWQAGEIHDLGRGLRALQHEVDGRLRRRGPLVADGGERAMRSVGPPEMLPAL